MPLPSFILTSKQKNMSIQKTLGGDRLGSGKKMTVTMDDYGRSTHDLSQTTRTTASVGTLIPVYVKLALPGDIWTLDIDVDIKTHPTIGPLFGSMKSQTDVFLCPWRLYQAQLHNNELEIGNNMQQVKLPQMYLTATPTTNFLNPDNTQINPSCIHAYLGIRGVGMNSTEGNVTRRFSALKLLSYWDIVKNYYTNKQEEVGAVIHSETPALIESVNGVTATSLIPGPGDGTAGGIPIGNQLLIEYTLEIPNLGQIMINTNQGNLSVQQLMNSVTNWFLGPNFGELTARVDTNRWGDGLLAYSWAYRTPAEAVTTEPTVWTFPLENLDTMRKKILAHAEDASAFILNEDAPGLVPYSWVIEENPDGITNYMNTQEGLAVKTYQSDLFNNWLKTEWITGPNSISAITSVAVVDGKWSIDSYNLASKLYEMLNRIAVSGGTYGDWIEANWAPQRYQQHETPIYQGGLSKEVAFQEVISNAQATNSDQSTQPLGTLGGRGVMTKKHKGGKVKIRVTEPSYIFVITSVTPRIDYSQGNQWDSQLENMDQLHKPALDQIGFQDAITEDFAWWATRYNPATEQWVQTSAGKQPSWIKYQTSVNEVYGNFADESEGWMVIRRGYQFDPATQGIKDLTTYIDPVRAQQIFADPSLDAQNLWIQVGIDASVSRIMSYKQIPNV